MYHRIVCEIKTPLSFQDKLKQHIEKNYHYSSSKLKYKNEDAVEEEVICLEDKWGKLYYRIVCNIGYISAILMDWQHTINYKEQMQEYPHNLPIFECGRLMQDGRCNNNCPLFIEMDCPIQNELEEQFKEMMKELHETRTKKKEE